MGGTACVAKKKMCNPPAVATFGVPELLIAGIGDGTLDRGTMEAAGLEDYLYRCAAIDEEGQAKYDEANKWFYSNIYRVEEGKPPAPSPWKSHEDKGDKKHGEGL
jgi:hypothetical protein